MPIVRLMGSSEAAEWNTTQISSWWESVKDRKDAAADAALLYSLFDALGEPVPSVSWEKLVSGKAQKMVSMPNPALWFRLIEATEAARQVAPETIIPSSSQTAMASETTSDATPEGTVAPPPKIRSRVAETILLSLLALGDNGPTGASPLLLHQVILSIRAAGFDKEARAMAVEAALAAGL